MVLDKRRGVWYSVSMNKHLQFAVALISILLIVTLTCSCDEVAGPQYAYITQSAADGHEMSEVACVGSTICIVIMALCILVLCALPIYAIRYSLCNTQRTTYVAKCALSDLHKPAWIIKDGDQYDIYWGGVQKGTSSSSGG